MARLPRLVLPGHAHVLILLGLTGHPVFADAADRHDFLQMLDEAGTAEPVALHAFALLETEVHLLATPQQPQSLGRWVQAVGRRYVSAHNRRHHRQGTLWSGRYRCAVVEPGPLRLAALQWVDGQPGAGALTSADHRLGGSRRAGLSDLPGVLGARQHALRARSYLPATAAAGSAAGAGERPATRGDGGLGLGFGGLYHASHLGGFAPEPTAGQRSAASVSRVTVAAN